MPTNRDRLLRKRYLQFTDRSEEIKKFKRLLSSDSEYSALHIIGIPGIGKTALLEACINVSADVDAICVLIDAGVHETRTSIVLSLYEQLQDFENINLENLNHQVTRYKTIENKVRSDINAPPELVTVLITGTTRKGRVPKDLQTDAARLYLAQNFGPSDTSFFLDPAPSFLESLLNDLCNKNRETLFCIIIDRYELVSSTTDAWVRDELFAELDMNVRFVTAGRKPLPEEWIEWNPLVDIIDLGRLDDGDIVNLVKLRGVTSEEAEKEIVRFARGLPLAASLASDIWRQSPSTDWSLVGARRIYDVVGQLVNRLTAEAGPDLQNWLKRCSILRQFTFTSLKEYVGVEDPDAALDSLSRLSFVRQIGRGIWTIHDLVRDFLNEDLRQKNPQEHQEMHLTAAIHYRNLMERSHDASREQHMVEYVYHSLRGDQDSGFIQLKELFDNATDFSRIDLSNALLQASENLNITAENEVWLYYFRAVLLQQKNVDNLKAAEMMKNLLDEHQIEAHQELKARTASYLSMTLWYLAEFDDALKYSRIGLKLSDELELTKFGNRALEAQGLTLDRLGYFSDALETQFKLLERTRQTADTIGEIWTLNNIGYFSWHAGKWDYAIETLNRCLELIERLTSRYNQAYPLGHLGLLYISIGQLDTGEEILQKGLKISQDEGNTEMESKILQNLCDLSLAQNKPGIALEIIDRALAINKTLVHPYFDSDSYRRRALVYLALDKSSEAFTDLQTSLSLARSLKALYIETRVLTVLRKLQLKQKDIIIDLSSKEIQNKSITYNYFNVVADLMIFEGEKAIQENDINHAATHFSKALLYAVQYNGYVLYNVLQSIFSILSTQKAPIAQNIKSKLFDYWNTAHLHEVPLLQLEKSVRDDITMLASLPNKVLEQLAN